MRDEEGNYLAYAKRPIKAGEEVRSASFLCPDGQKAITHPFDRGYSS